jgi:chaperonin GroEL
LPKEIRFHAEARKLLLAGMNEVADAVGATLGPRGQTNVLSRPFGAPLVTKDGVTVARDIVLKDRWANEGAKLIQEVAQKTNAIAGDGTTAATVLARALFAEGEKRVAQGADRRAIEYGMQRAVGIVIERLKQMATGIHQNDLEVITAVATIAANSDKEVGEVIARAIHTVGLEGLVQFDQSPTTKTTFDVASGLQFDRGYLSPVFINQPQRGEVAFQNPNIFVTDRRLIDPKVMIAFLQAYTQKAGKVPLVIVCEDCEGAALQALVVNNHKALEVAVVRTPGVGPAKKEQIEDVAIYCGAKPYMVQTGEDPAKLNFDDLGSADAVVINAHQTAIIGGKGNELRMDVRKDEIRSRLADPKIKDFDKAVLERRLALLSSAIAVIHIGASIQSKLLEKRDRVEDSVNATKAALEEGFVPGGGTALVRCLPYLREYMRILSGDARFGAEIVAEAIKRPMRTIAENAGVDPDYIVASVLGLRYEDELLTFSDIFRPFTCGERPMPVVPRCDRLIDWGYNAADDRFQNLVEAGIVDPVKVVRLALENAAELAGLLLTTAALIVEFPDPEMARFQPPAMPATPRG